MFFVVAFLGVSLTLALDCNDPLWCNIEIPAQSYFGFKDSIDPLRWKEAQALAASGQHILAQEVRKVIKHPYDFIDGDESFRNIEDMVDFFVDPKTMLAPITNGFISDTSRQRYKKEIDEFGKDDESFIRRKYQTIFTERSPIAQIGSFRYGPDGKIVMVRANAVRSADRNAFLAEFAEAEDRITRPSIFVCALNENWGWISTTFPDRTNRWGRYPKPHQVDPLMKFLDSPKTVMMVVNQHFNVSHPKLLALPRGIPLQWENVAKIVWDAMAYVLEKKQPKSHLLVSMASNWGPRPQIVSCISKKFQPNDFFGHSDAPDAVLAPDLPEPSTPLEKRGSYYVKLSRGYFVLMLPGLGYDCFRNWESLLMGAVGVAERGVGLDRTYWRLPVLLVDDFYDITPELLRSAYVEAVYRRKEFEFERLRQSYWYSVIYNVSVTGHAGPMLDKFPMEAEKRGFIRPFEPFYCGRNFENCGSPILTPEHSC